MRASTLSLLIRGHGGRIRANLCSFGEEVIVSKFWRYDSLSNGSFGKLSLRGNTVWGKF
jgi:hypothetical protein